MGCAISRHAGDWPSGDYGLGVKRPKKREGEDASTMQGTEGDWPLASAQRQSMTA